MEDYIKLSEKKEKKKEGKKVYLLLLLRLAAIFSNLFLCRMSIAAAPSMAPAVTAPANALLGWPAV